jgi:hypothetical protein
MQHQNTNGPRAIGVELSCQTVSALVLKVRCEHWLMEDYTGRVVEGEHTLAGNCH